MQKDVIYIDVDDDVTAIIGKIKKSKEKIVAIVPPKRAGALQSAVNLRLLDRMAKTGKKNLVLVTNNQALIALAANAAIPVAKNLQSKPELAEIPALAVDDEDDIIDGSDLPVGDHADSVKVSDGTNDKKPESTDSRTDVIDGMDIDGEEVETAAAVGAGSSVAKKAAAARNKIKIPNFDKFRKRLFLGITGAVLLIALLIWMFGFAPSATVIITAKTTPAPVSAAVQLVGTGSTSVKAGTVKFVTQQEKKDETVSFTATGKKDLGAQATGTVTFSTTYIPALGTVIPAGTKLTASSGAVFTTNSAVTMTTNNYTGANVDITAVSSGTGSNGATGSMSGAPSHISADLTGPTAGGTTKVVTTVSAGDVALAQGQLVGQSTDAEKASLSKKFTNGEKVIGDSFTIDRAAPVSSPAVDAEDDSGKATLTVSTTYTIYAIPQTDLTSYITDSLNAQIGTNKNLKIYSTGVSSAGIANFVKSADGTLTATITATGQIGPQIDENAIKQQVKGKIYGEVQSTLQSINGIDSVDVKFPYFWVTSVPNDVNKIHIEFKVQNG